MHLYLADVVDREPLTIAVSSGGAAPCWRAACAAASRRSAAAARQPRPFRRAVSRRGQGNPPSGLARRRFWDRFFTGAIAEQVLAGDEYGAGERMLAGSTAASGKIRRRASSTWSARARATPSF
ncbi:MAG: hypothetical protein U1E35_08215 [Rhodospirillales bacterium]